MVMVRVGLEAKLRVGHRGLGTSGLDMDRSFVKVFCTVLQPLLLMSNRKS